MNRLSINRNMVGVHEERITWIRGRVAEHFRNVCTRQYMGTGLQQIIVQNDRRISRVLKEGAASTYTFSDWR